MKTFYLLLISAGLFLVSCGPSRNLQYGDDVYYSPNRAADDGGYVSVYNDDDLNSYNYQEDYDIRRGIRNPIYRSSFNLSLGFGMGSPFMYGMSPFSSMYFNFGNPFFRPYAGSMYGMGFYPYSAFSMYSPFGGFYNPYYPSMYYGGYYGGGYGHGILGGYGSPIIVNNGPRVTNLGGYNTSGTSGYRPFNNQTGNIRTTAPTRTLRSVGEAAPNNSNGRRGFFNRVFSGDQNNAPRINRSSQFGRNNGDSRYVTPAQPRREIRSFNENNNREFAPQRNESRSVTPRQFSNPSPAPRMSSPSMSSPAPRVSSGGGGRFRSL